MDQRIETGVAQMPGQQRRRRCAVDVVVAEDRDTLAPDRGIGDAFRYHLHIRQRERIGHQLAHGRIEKIRNRIDLDAAPGEHARKHLRHLMTLGDRQRARRAAHVQPIAPDLAGGRARDAEKRQSVVEG